MKILIKRFNDIPSKVGKCWTKNFKPRWVDKTQTIAEWLYNWFVCLYDLVKNWLD